MTIRQSDLEALKSKKMRRKRRDRNGRDLHLEQLEDRRLLATLQLAGVLPNNGVLLNEGDVRNVAPQELLLRFSDGADIDPASLGAIEIIRSGGDGAFESASVSSDLNTNGAVVMRFSAVQPGQAGNGIILAFDATNRGSSPAPAITVEGRRITIQYNSNPSAPTTAFDLREAIQNTPDAARLIQATVTRGNAFTAIGNRLINYSPLTLNGANASTGSTNFGLGSNIQVRFTAVQSGQMGNDLRITFSKFNPGGAAAPVVTVNGRTINIALNASTGNESTVQDVVAAVNSNSAANQLVRAQLVSGNPATKVGSAPTPAPVDLTGANDFTIDPGYIDVLDPGNQVVVRFQENLPDDSYLISVFGTGENPLQTVDGVPFNDGERDFRLGFELDLAPQIVSVVPQPITRNAQGGLQQARDEIHVYFNDDDLDPASAVRPDFYQLIFTKDTARNTDDQVFLPVSVTYNAAQDRAILKFAAALDLLGAGQGTFRLRIGTDEAAPLPPVQLAPAQDAGSSFVTALDLSADFDTGTALVFTGGGQAFQDGQVFTIVDRTGNQATFEYDSTPAGVRPGNIPIAFSSGFDSTAMAQVTTLAINNVLSLNVNATQSGTTITLSGDAEVTLDPTMRGMAEATRGLVLSGAITNTGQPYVLDLPGAGVSEETGHRDIVIVQDHLESGADSVNGITTAFYNFQDVYGFDPEGNPLQNAITPVQMQRAREIFQIYSDTLGIQFIESANSGMTIVTGDLRAIAPGVTNGRGGVLALNDGPDINTGRAIMDLQDYSDVGDDVYGGRWFQAAMHQIGHLLGLGNADELPAPTIMSSQTFTAAPGSYEPVYPSDADIIHGQHLYRPESKDIDLYRFEVFEEGIFSAETLAERQANPSQLDTVLTLYREEAGVYEVVASNDDYYSEDSFLEVSLTPGVYYIGVSASGNNQYDPTIEDSGFGGVSQGDYQLRLNFRGEVDNSIIDADNANSTRAGALSRATPLDGDADGVPGGVYDFWFRGVSQANTIYVDLWSASNPAVRRTGGAGTLANPYSNITTALNAAAPTPGKVVRLVGNGGADGDIATLDDNLAYEVGFSSLNGTTPLLDGSTISVPKGVTLMIDAGAMLKMRRSRIGVGSSSTLVDRSAGALQILGAPRLFDASGNVRLDAFGAPLGNSVIFTSLHDTIGVDQNPDSSPPPAREGDWGGIVFRRDIDSANSTRFDYEDQAIFLNYVNHADVRYGGGNVVIDGFPQIVAPISMIDSRPTIGFNMIRFSADAAMSANPDSSEESNFHSPPYQISGSYTSDYNRVGPDIYGNTLVDNSLNGLFVRIATPAGNQLQKMNVSGRWDDADIVVVLQENLKIAGTPGGLVLEQTPPGVTLVTLQIGAVVGGLEPGTYNYRLVNVDNAGNEGPPSSPTRSLTLNLGETSIRLNNLQPAGPGFVARRLYRSVDGGPYTLVTALNATSNTYTDDGTTLGGPLEEFALELRPRLDARLRIDPGVIVKLEGAVIEVEMGAQLLAEGVDGGEVVITSLRDTRYGAGGTFNTNDQAANVAAAPGNWAGIYVAPQSSISMDYAVVAFGGGVTRVDGAFRAFNPVEIHQSESRIAHTMFEFNADGIRPGTAVDRSDSRFGRGFNDRGTLFVRGSQPVLVGNTFINNNGLDSPAISIDVNSLNNELTNDLGRSTGAAERFPNDLGNRGPLVVGNMLYNNGINGMVVRGGEVTTEATLDDTDIVHVVLDEIIVPNFHTYGGLRLESTATESLVVKLRGANAGITAAGDQLDIVDRVGGSVIVLGQPGFPVVLTSLTDDSAGAGFDPFGSPQTDTDNNAVESEGPQLPIGPEVNRGTLIDDDAFQTTPGFFSFNVGNGGNDTFGGGGGVTVQGNSGLFVNQDFVFDFLNFVDVGSDGSALNLGTETTITTPATLIGDDLVVSEGTFQGENGLITWRVESFFEDGVPTLFNKVSFSSDQPLGNLQFVNYLDEDVFFVSDDLLYLTGTPGEPDFRAFTLDDAERVGFSHGGVYQTDGNFLANASYDGWAADEFADLLFDIDLGPGKNYSIPGDIDTTSLLPFNDPELGQVYGLEDITTAFAWTADPGANFAVMTSFLELIPRNPALLLGQPGDWRSVRLDPLSNDRNVAPISEREAADLVAPGSNGVTDNAQYLGQLAPYQKSGDDNLRLGFEIRGRLSSPADVDVYSFKAQAGTDVIFDIDRTTVALDSVVELITADGEVLARSDNSVDESANPFLIFRNPGIAASSVNPLPTKDVYSINPRDAGMQIRLPGANNEENIYYVRVRSSSGNLDNVAGGTTSGAYQLQIRLQGKDETLGSTVSYADIRFASTGVEVLGVPAKSPLAGEIAEVESNGAIIAAQPIGNMMESDLGALSTAGRLATYNDVDFYQFEVNYEQVAIFPDPAPDRLVAVTIDLDYADGLGRANTVVTLYDAGGNQIATSNRSNVADDRPVPGQGNGLTNLSLGSVGPLDPFLGPILLPQGTYYFAVTSNALIANDLGQYRQANPSNPLIRLEPATSIGRIAEDHINQPGFRTTAAAPQIPVLLDNASPRPLFLGDAVLYISRDSGLDQTEILTVDPFTGAREASVGKFNFDVGDIDFRDNENLYAFTLDLEQFPTTDADTGNYLMINTENAITTNLGDDGIITYNRDPADPTQIVQSNPVNGNPVGYGIQFDGLTYSYLGGIERGFAVGGRPAFNFSPGIGYDENILYEFTPDTGIAFSAPGNDRTGDFLANGAGTQILERGHLLTDADPFGNLGRVIITPEATTVTTQTNSLILDGTAFSVDDSLGNIVDFEFVSGPEIRVDLQPGLDPPLFIRDGDRFFLDGVAYEFDTGEVLIVDAANGNFITDGQQFTVTDNQLLPVTRRFEFNDGSGPPVGSGIIEVPFNVGMTRAQIVASIVNTINSQTAFRPDGTPIYSVAAQAMPTANAGFSNRISLINATAASESAVGISIQGSFGAGPGATRVPIEEVSRNDDVALGQVTIPGFHSSMDATFDTVVGVDYGGEGTRANFQGASTGNFSQLVARGVVVDLGHDDMPTAGAISVPFLADDSDADIAQRMVDAIDGLFSGAVILSASSNGPVITLGGNSRFVNVDDPPLTLAGAAPGGNITGITFVGTAMYAVSDAGGLFRIFNPTSPLGAVADYIESASDLLGINFQGLTAAPPDLEGGIYAQMLFGIDGNGRLYAFNLAGELQQVFANGQTSIATGVSNTHGLTFSELGVNPWHIVNNRRDLDAGHGVNLLFDLSREPGVLAPPTREGNSSFYFGRALTQDTDPRYGFAPFAPVSTDDINLPDANYDFAGGAHGILESNPFSLVGYAPEDLPTLYFNYYLQTEGVDATGANPMRDAFRVYASNASGQWTLLASNVEEPAVFTGQPVYDIAQNAAPDSWRQARVDLSSFAGLDNVRLRFDFTTTGTFLAGNPNYGGDELRTIPGADLRDGQTFIVSGRTFEIELGPTLVTTEGKDIADGETLTVHGVTFEFNKTGGVVPGRVPIQIDDAQSAQAVAEAVERALRNANFTFTANMTAEDNDVIARAVDSGLRGGANVFRASGAIGDNPNFAFNPGLDVDMLRVDLNAGNIMEVNVTRPGGSALDSYLRVFNVTGTQVAATNADSLTFTPSATGTYYLGLSGSPNSGYNPQVAGSGIPGSTGAYNLEIVVNNFAGVLPRLHDNRVQLDGASQVSQSINSANSLDGAAGVRAGNVAVVLNSDMSAEDVASIAPGQRQLNGRDRYVPVIAALANTLANGSEIAIKTYQDLVLLIGQDLNNRGPFGGSTSLALDSQATLNSNFCTTGGVDDFGCGTDLNDFEGVYIDDVIIGFAEHGEFATGANSNDTFFEKNPNEYATEIVVGEYDVEIRRSDEYGLLLQPLGTFYFDTFDTNYRHATAVQLIAPPAEEIIDGQVFSINDGVTSVRFEFEDVNINDGVQQGHIPILFDPTRSQGGGVSADTTVVMARRIRDAINSAQVQAVLNVQAGLDDGAIGGNSTAALVNLYGNAIVAKELPILVDGDLTTEGNDTDVTADRPVVASGQSAIITTPGAIGDNPALIGNNAPLDVDLMALALTSGSTLRVDIDANENGSPLDSLLRIFDVSGAEIARSDNFPAPGESFSNDPYLELVIPTTGTYYIGLSSAGNGAYDIFSAPSGVAGGTTGPYELSVEIEGSGIDFVQFNGKEDPTRDRPQGQVIVENSTITRSLQYGVLVDAGARASDSGETSPGAVRNLREVNTNALLPGAVVQNNVITFNNEGGIRVSGVPTNAGEPQAPAPFARITNNTLVGRGGTLNASVSGGSDVGITVDQNASPTLLNNVVANFENGIQVDATSQSTIIGGTLYQGNDFNSNFGLGDFPLVLANSQPLFLDLATENFYPAPLSQTIDSSINSLEDRLALISVKQPLGIAPSPILAPQYDSIGQLRADDPDVEPPSGFGSNVFVDRGAIDRADFAGPTAVLIDPRDNDAAGLDLDDAATVVELSSSTLYGFSIQLVDGVEPIDPQNGVGVNDATVTKEQVAVLRDEEVLLEGVDYRFRYDALNNLIRLTPLAGIWPTNHVYTIVLANSDQFVIRASSGSSVPDGQAFTVVDQQGNQATFEFESGYSLRISETLSLQIPQAGGGLGGVTDRQTLVVTRGTDTATLEFDNNGSVAAGNIAVVFTPTSTDDDLAATLVAALKTADIGLSPKVLPDGRVHVGTTAQYAVNIAGAPSLTRSGTEGGGIAEGDLLRVDDGTKVINYEFDNNGAVTAGNTAFTFSNSETYLDLATRLTARLDSDVASLTPVNYGDGFIHIGGQKFHKFDASQSQLTLTGQPGVTPGFGLQIPTQAGKAVGIDDGDRFTLGDGIGLPVTFEFDSNNSVVPGNTRIGFTASTTLNQLANAIAAAIASVNIGLNPTNLGNGCIDLGGGTTLHFFDPATSSLTQLGQPGVPGNIAVPYVPDESFTDQDLARVIRDAINSSDLEGVTATSRGGEIVLDGAADVLGIADAFITGIRDNADNLMKANQSNGGTTFTIILGSGLDFGDAPDSYGTLSESGGPSHTVDSEFHLGPLVDVEVNGIPTIGAVGDNNTGLDDQDGVTWDSFRGGYDTVFTVNVFGVTGARPGFVNAWIDFNRNGVFDASEHVLTDVSVVDGPNVFNVAVPSGVSIGDSYARFRLSSETGLGSGGAAANGEVEDYLVNLQPSAWRNPNIAADVQPDGVLTPFDVLRVVSLLQREGLPVVLPKDPPLIIGGTVITTPPYVDPTGDGRVDLRDVSFVTAALFLQANGSSEAEGEAALAGFGDATESSTLVGNFNDDGEGEFQTQLAAPLESTTAGANSQDPLQEQDQDQGTFSRRGASNTRTIQEVAFRLSQAGQRLRSQPEYSRAQVSLEQQLMEDLTAGFAEDALDRIFADF